MNVSRLLAAAFLVFPLLVLPAAHGQDKAGGVAAATAETVVTVVDVDREKRVVTVRGPAGGLTTLNVPPEAQNLDQVRVGSRFKVTYLASVALALSKGTGSPTSSTSRQVKLAPKGDTPGGAVVDVRQENVVVEKIDRDTRTITVRGTEGGPRELQVDESVKAFDQVSVGDTISVQFTEGLALRMLQQ
jgi:hypothetical protein